MYGNSIQETRQLFYLSWQKYCQKKPLSPLEEQIVAVVLLHPEYHARLESLTPDLEAAHFAELGQENPFLHMGLHLAIRDQIALNKPFGIARIFQQLMQRYQDESIVEHLLMERLAACLWKAQQTQTPPDELAYLQSCAAI